MQEFSIKDQLLYINGDSYISGKGGVDPGPWVEDQPRGKLLIRPTHLKTRPSPVLIRTRPIPGTSWSNSPNPKYIIFWVYPMKTVLFLPIMGLFWRNSPNSEYLISWVYSGETILILNTSYPGFMTEKQS